jgi:hypothetical protein
VPPRAGSLSAVNPDWLGRPSWPTWHEQFLPGLGANHLLGPRGLKSSCRDLVGVISLLLARGEIGWSGGHPVCASPPGGGGEKSPQPHCTGNSILGSGLDLGVGLGAARAAFWKVAAEEATRSPAPTMASLVE